MDQIKKLGKNILINDSQIEVLKKYEIFINDKMDIKEILLLIDRKLNLEEFDDEEYKELDDIAATLQERSYYAYTNK